MHFNCRINPYLRSVQQTKPKLLINSTGQTSLLPANTQVLRRSETTNHHLHMIFHLLPGGPNSKTVAIKVVTDSMTVAYFRPLCVRVQRESCQPLVSGNNYTLTLSLHGWNPFVSPFPESSSSEFGGTSDLVISKLMLSHHCCWENKNIAVLTGKQK